MGVSRPYAGRVHKPIVQDLRLPLNADYPLSARYLENGEAVAMSDARMQIRASEDAEGPALVDVSAPDSITLDAVTGWVEVLLTVEDMAPLAAVAGTAVAYDLVATRTDNGRRIRLLEGRALPSRGVTRDDLPEPP